MLANKVKTFLNVLGIMIGIASVIIVFSAGEGIRGLVMSQIESFGTDIIQTEIKVPSGKNGVAAQSQSASALAQGVQITTLNLDDMDDIAGLPNVKNAYAAILNQGEAVYEGERRKVNIFGVTAGYEAVDSSEVEFGRYYTDEEDNSLAQVVVLGSKVAEKLFAQTDPLDKSIKIQGKKFRVIGVMKERGAVVGMDFDDYVYMPLQTLQKKMLGVDHVLYMMHQLVDVSKADETAEEARLILRENHGIVSEDKDDFRVVTMKEMMETLETVTSVITLLLLAIVAISLVVGGVGIMNIMYVAVTERTGEIGLRKAVGANFRDIMYQFLIEAVIITLLGGAVGVAIGVFISYIISVVASEVLNFDWRFVVPLKAYVTALGFSAFFGIVFGTFPARKAAKMDPIQALYRE